MPKFRVAAAALFACAAFLAACASNPTPVVEKPAPAPATVKTPVVDTSMLPADCKLGKSVSVDGAVIYAVSSKGAPNHTDYLTLDEAMAAKVATIKEVGADEAAADPSREVSGSVNTLLCCNESDKPLFLMAGDLVLGGKQDRILAESIVVAPRTRNMEIPVFCVEHGRWTPQDKDAERVETGVFYNEAKTGQCDLAVKKAALETREQGEVWRKVADNNKSLNVEGEASSGTFRSTFDNKATQEKIEANWTKARSLTGEDVIGYAVFVDGKMMAMDIFDSSKLAGKLSEKLLRSYIVTGLSGGYTEKAVQDERAALGRAAPVMNMNTHEGQAPQMTGSNEPAEASEAANTESVYGMDHVQNARGDRLRNGRPSCGTLNTERAAVEDKDRVETTAVNTRTETTRDYKKDSLGYTCNDKDTGKPVQRSFLRR